MSASSRRAIGSRLDDGSSSTRTSGRIASTVASGHPPTLAEAEVVGRAVGARGPCRRPPAPRRSAPPSSSPRSPRLAGPNATSSRTVDMNSWSSGSWNTIPTRRRISARFAFSTASPPTVTVPRVATLMPLSASTSVVLPAPLGPSIATRSPAATSRSTPSRAPVAVGVGGSRGRARRAPAASRLHRPGDHGDGRRQRRPQQAHGPRPQRRRRRAHRHRARVAPRRHRQVHPLAPLVRAHEQRPGRRRPRLGPGRSSWPTSPRDSRAMRMRRSSSPMTSP